jgi:hypothetical protein
VLLIENRERKVWREGNLPRTVKNIAQTTYFYLSLAISKSFVRPEAYDAFLEQKDEKLKLFLSFMRTKMFLLWVVYFQLPSQLYKIEHFWVCYQS